MPPVLFLLVDGFQIEEVDVGFGLIFLDEYPDASFTISESSLR
jgi:hypothetical protein